MVLGADNAGRPFNQLYGRTANVQTWFRGDTNYHSLQAKLDRRFKNGFLLTTSYTLSRAENYSDEAGIATPADVERSFGPAGFDRTHVFASAFIWDLPFFKEGNGALALDPRRLAVQRHLHRVLRHPDQLHRERAPRCGRRATRSARTSAATPEVFGDIGPGQKYFDTSAFSAPAQNTWGNMNAQRLDPRSRLLEPRRFAREAASASATVSVELRADAFNLTNTPHFNNPNGAFGAATFGEINSSFGQRLVRFGARVMF